MRQLDTPGWGTEPVEEAIRAHPPKGPGGLHHYRQSEQPATPAVMFSEAPIAAFWVLRTTETEWIFARIRDVATL